MEGGISQFKVWIQEIGKHEMFWEPNCMLFYLFNIFYRVVERLSLIRGYRHGWPNHVKTSCIFV